MERTGFRLAPLRDEGLPESAIMRPQMAAHYRQAGLVQQGALLAVGISQAQAYVDGNKRTAFAALNIFLYLNGRRYAGDPIKLAKQLEAIATRDVDLDTATRLFTEWLRTHVEKW